MTGETPKAVIYCRIVSSTTGAIDRALTDQEDICREFASNAGYDVVKVFREHASGTDPKRAELQVLLSFLETQSGDVRVIVADSSRLARRPSLHVSLHDRIAAAGARVEGPWLQDDRLAAFAGFTPAG